MPMIWFIGARFCLGGLQIPAGNLLIDVADDRVRLVEIEAVMGEGRHLAERIARQERWLLVIALHHRDVDELVGGRLFFEGETHSTHIGAEDGTTDDRRGHEGSPCCYLAV